MNTLRITRADYDSLRRTLLGEGLREVAVFLIAGFYQDERGHHFTVREIMVPKDQDFDVQEDLRLQVSPVFFNKVISRAEALGLTVVMTHSHPFAEGEVHYSSADDYGEGISSKTIYDCLGEKPSASLLFGQNRVNGRVWIKPDQEPEELHEIRIFGREGETIPLMTDNQAPSVNGIFARQVAVYGKAGQDALASLVVGIVGVGGTGSAVAEQLVRLGVRRFVIVDKDVFEDTNVTRLYGSNWAHVKAKKKPPKVEILHKHLTKLAPNVKVVAIPSDVMKQDVLKKLARCDLLFSCMDRHAPRSVLNEVSYQYFIPLIDVGVGIDATEGTVRGGAVRATVAGPGLPCLYCYGIVRPDVITAELLPAEERKSRAAEGYVPGITYEAPSVVHLTNMAASMGVTLAMDYSFRLSENPPSTLMMDLSDYTLHRLAVKTRDDCVCRHRLARADAFPLSAPA